MTEKADITLEYKQPNEIARNKLLEQGIDPLLANLYASRGVKDASEVNYCTSDLLGWKDLKNAAEMGSILTDCVSDKSRVLIVSDYDCDGATAGSVLIEAFGSAGMNFGYLVPDRLKHGYGLTSSIVDEAAALTPKPKYIITVDNGISSHDGIERARHHGIEVLVTDHHLCPPVLPNAKLIVNPQQPDDKFESKNVAGCGVAWYVAYAMHDEMIRRGMPPGFDPLSLTPYVALGTVADMVKLDKNNRILVSDGLQRIRKSNCSAGILALANVAKRDHANLTCSDIGFALGPRVNAAGRMAHMSSGIECLTTRDHDQALTLAMQLDEINKVRRELQKSMAEEAIEKVGIDAIQKASTHQKSAKSIVVFEPEWHEGVVGIVAGRIKDEQNLPTFVLCHAQDGGIKGSGRSIAGFHLKHALDEINIAYPGLIKRFGGHAPAAGITLEADGYEKFKAAFEDVCQKYITPQMLEKKLRHDGELPARHLNVDDIRMMDLQVWGQDFEQPVFVDEFKVLNARTMGQEKEHLKITVSKDGARLDVVAFGEGERINDLPKALRLVFSPNINEWRDTVSIQLMAQHLMKAPALEAELTLQEATKVAIAKAKAPAKKSTPAADPFDKVDTKARFSAMMANQRAAQAEQPTVAPQAVAAKEDESPAPQPSSQRLKFAFRR